MQEPGNNFPVAEPSRRVFSISLHHSKGNHRQICCHFLIWCQDRGLLGEEEAKGKRDMRRNNDWGAKMGRGVRVKDSDVKGKVTGGSHQAEHL